MGRRVRDAKLETRAARAKLPVRGKPYYRLITSNLSLGYRKGQRGGSFLARKYLGREVYEFHQVGTADDITEADGLRIFDFNQAQEKALEWFKQATRREHGLSDRRGRYAVDDCLMDYMKWFELNRKTRDATQHRIDTLIKPTLGKLDTETLTAAHIKNWLNDLARRPAVWRHAKKGKPAKIRPTVDVEDAARARKDSANRALTILKAALNHGYKEGNISSDRAWREVERFRNVEKRRLEYLRIEEAIRLVNTCEPELRRIVKAALYTGARYSELARLKVRSFDSNARSIHFERGKTESRHVALSDEAVEFFLEIAAGRSPDATLIVKDNGEEWRTSQQGRAFRRACERASISKGISFHSLRHTFASLSIQNGAHLMVVAQALGHADSRMVELHYGHLSRDHVNEVVRLTAPKLMNDAVTNLRTLRTRVGSAA